MRKNKKIKDFVELIIKNAAIRTGLTTRKLQWFFRIYFDHYIKYNPAPFHKTMLDVAENNKIKLAVIAAFRGSAKSTLMTTVYAIWSMLGKQKKKFVLILGSTDQKNRQYMQNIKLELESNELLKKDLGPFEEEKTQWGAQALVLPKLGAKIAVSSTEQSIRGLRYGAYRPDLIIIDDAEDLNSVRSVEVSEKIYNWFVSEVIPAGDKDTRIIVLGTMLTEGSLMARLKESILKGERDGVYYEFPFLDEKGEALWKEKFPDAESVEAERKKIGDEVAFSTEMLLDPIIKEDRVIYPEWIKYYDSIPKDVRYVAIGIDPAIQEHERADFTAMVSGVVVSDNSDLYIYILPNPVNERLTALETADRAEMLSRTTGGNALAQLFVEDVGYQKALVEILQSRILPVEEVKLFGKDKRARLVAISHLFQQGRILFPRQGCEILIEQLLRFGVRKDHDDLVDATTALIRKVVEKDVKKSGFLVMMERDMKEMRNNPQKFMQLRGIGWWVDAARRGYV